MLPWKSFVATPYNEHYNGAYADRDIEWRRLTGRGIAKHIQKVLGSRASEIDTVLDAGCGTGIVIHELAKLGVGKHFTGVDLADPNEHITPELKGAPNVVLESYDGVTLPYLARSFDLVFASHVLEHVQDERQFLGQIARVAKNLIYVEVPTELNLLTGRDRMQLTLDIGHLNAYTPESLMLTLETSGMRVIGWQLFDIDSHVRTFQSGSTAAVVRGLVKGAMLKINPLFASRLFTFHCAALCVPAP